MSTSSIMESGAWNNQRLASELGNPFSDSRPGGASWAQVGRSKLLGAIRLKNNARALPKAAPPPGEISPNSPLGLARRLASNMAEATTTLLLARHGKFPKPGIDPDVALRPGENVDVEG